MFTLTVMEVCKLDNVVRELGIQRQRDRRIDLERLEKEKKYKDTQQGSAGTAAGKAAAQDQGGHPGAAQPRPGEGDWAAGGAGDKGSGQGQVIAS